jgi:hypothetical protein
VQATGQAAQAGATQAEAALEVAGAGIDTDSPVTQARESTTLFVLTSRLAGLGAARFEGAGDQEFRLSVAR